ncbi:PREDICTED: acyl-CoA-binding domain-containing protein 5 [Rhagoletis zephyria]|uniref:acyl-CoA-binding domain-containing protein 5 n=1 Tax=Rhagoletis zephyria TaxID=28612 RepID=UPI00081148B5|nr:PREDICTED: acyl-CoA-binding domain-containing protein 5 [Rhagoletis zephyria]XP_017474083.1 PREDICTED: acyl-CoA-binding domain-containing protein 5 [Rhagoletis zephyria]XP_017474088.1 PREDICTED: acyl-CoA-binding domain-containing protein 5 [Rhagoletis zephyria]XP_036321291.1 acyl-CoA-binding domain-containing protein 5 [Rhagoletis pomonella]XP_036321292.1 acyl-CoA-binding domain-containing protein 5 [Rhagoletis pomonella]XP_036321293.1 acyl-CoA-binding domain-containing protein 5 [Rhagoleti
MASIEERFQAAVNVIKGLPKNGPYQPSTAMMLKFYGYYKQATEGPCHQKRPGFWDVVGKAKWDAWNDNRHLTKHQAMERYVENLREIIETMSFTENVQNFVGSISGLDNINLDELDMVAPGMRELAESHPNSPFNSRTNSPQHGASVNGSSGEEDDLSNTVQFNGHVSKKPNHIDHNSGLMNGTTEHEEIIATQSKPTTSMMPEVSLTLSTYATSSGTVDQSDDEYGDPVDLNGDLTEAMVHNSELLKQVQATVLRMNADLVAVNQRMNSLEKVVNDVRSAVVQNAKPRGRKYPKWWPFEDISPIWFTLLVLWPFVVGKLSRALTAPRRK